MHLTPELSLSSRHPLAQPIDTIKLEFDESLECGRIYNQYLGGSGTGGDTIKLELYEMRVWQDLQPISWRWGADGGRNNLCGRRTHTVGTNTQYGREYERTQLNTVEHNVKEETRTYSLTKMRIADVH